MENSNFIILNTTLTEKLIKEGIAREIVSKVQNLRKEKDFEIENRIKLYYNCNEKIENAINDNLDYIKKETLSLEVIKDERACFRYDINSDEMFIDVEVVK